MSSTPRIILFRYELSPFSHKIENILLLKKISFSTVEVNYMLPRPEINELGIGYRRIPVLAIDNDVYCDTSLIVSILEKRFPASNGYGSIYPANLSSDRTVVGALNASGIYLLEVDLVRLGLTASVPWGQFPEDFIKDWSQYLGTPIDPVEFDAQAPAARAELAAHVSIINSQLSDGREWLLDTVSPSYADVSLVAILTWIKSRDENKFLFDKSQFSYVAQWFDHTTEYIQEKQAAGWGVRTEISKEEASIITSSSFQPYDVVGFDQDQAARLGLELGCTVSVTPTDTGKDNPTIGKLVSLAFNEIVLEIQGKNAPTYVRCHLPVLRYNIKKVE